MSDMIGAQGTPLLTYTGTGSGDVIESSPAVEVLLELDWKPVKMLDCDTLGCALDCTALDCTALD